VPQRASDRRRRGRLCGGSEGGLGRWDVATGGTRWPNGSAWRGEASPSPTARPLLVELVRRGYSRDDRGGNLLRVWREVEEVAAESKDGHKTS